MKLNKTRNGCFIFRVALILLKNKHKHNRTTPKTIKLFKPPPPSGFPQRDYTRGFSRDPHGLTGVIYGSTWASRDPLGPFGLIWLDGKTSQDSLVSCLVVLARARASRDPLGPATSWIFIFMLCYFFCCVVVIFIVLVVVDLFRPNG